MPNYDPFPNHAPFSGDSSPHRTQWFLSQPSPYPKQHLDRFIGFCSSEVVTNRHADHSIAAYDVSSLQYYQAFFHRFH